MGTATCQDWSTWMDLGMEYNGSKKKMRRYRQEIREHRDKTSEDLVHMELASSMDSELSKMAAEMEKRVLYQLGSMDEKDIKAAGLTDRQKEVALLKQQYSYTQIGEMLGMAASSVFSIYQDAVNKTKKYVVAKTKDQPYGLSKQQLIIYKLHREGKSRSEIAILLGMHLNGVGVQLRRIEQKIEKNKIT